MILMVNEWWLSIVIEPAFVVYYLLRSHFYFIANRHTTTRQPMLMSLLDRVFLEGYS